jgi:cobalt-zinc-cadmium efflux system membrane fusion protein
MKSELKYWLGTCIMIAVPFICSCHQKEQGKTDPSGEADSISQVDAKPQISEIIITRDQFESSGMKMEDPKPMVFQKKINANGYIVASPTGWVKVNTLIPGRVRQINRTEGDYIKKGEPLFTVESNEIVMLQQDYAEAYYMLNSLKASYERQKALAEENITSRKEFNETESNYRSLLAKTEGLKTRLRMIHIDPEQVENGVITPESPVCSPIQGFISKMDLVLGQFIEPQETVMELIDVNQLQLNLYVFENDLKDMAVGQKVLYYNPGNMQQIYEAVLSHIGKSIDPETKTVLCKARIKREDQISFVNHNYVKTEIISNQREVMAIPVASVSRENSRYYALVLASDNGDQLIFNKIPVQIGDIMQDYAEVLDKGLKNILTAGAYNFFIEE